MTTQTSALIAVQLEGARADLAAAAAKVRDLEATLRATKAQEAAAREAAEKAAIRKARTQAKALAEKHGVEIELHKDVADDAWYVDHPDLRDTDADPHYGDHYVHDWRDILDRVQSYAAALAKEPTR